VVTALKRMTSVEIGLSTRVDDESGIAFDRGFASVADSRQVN